MKSWASKFDIDVTSGCGVEVRMESISTRRRCFAVIASTPRHSPVDSAQCCADGPSSFDGAVAPSAAASLSLVNVNVGGGVQFPVGGGGDGRCIGASVRGVSRSSSSKLPAHASLLVRKPVRLNKFFTYVSWKKLNSIKLVKYSVIH
jgi:hypothetical protein